jgi:hypothetical protein
VAIGDESAGFRPNDPLSLQDWVDTRWPATLAASVKALTRQVTAPPAPEVEEKSRSAMARFSLAQVAGFGATVVLLAIVVAALVARNQPSPNLALSIHTTTTIPPIPAPFTVGVDQVTFQWNEAADQLRLNLFLLETPGPNRLQMNLAAGVTLYATEDPATGLVRTLMLAAGPTEDEAGGELVLAAWGTLIAMVNPELDGAERRDLLDALSVEPNRPLPNGLETTATAGGATYTLRSGVLGGRALLVVTPNR